MRADTLPRASTSDDHKSTLHLPKTAFPMRPGSAKLEPELLDAWGADNGYKALRALRSGATPFVLHDGPPYANGHLHMGHAVNKVLKDVFTRARRMEDRDAVFRPGWDCHGLPVEWKVEEAFRAAGRSKHDVPALEFRQACRDYASGWVDTQSSEFRRLGVAADWEDPYLTMDFAAEAAVARSFFELVETGCVYRGLRPVMWSPVEETALAEAEVEYHDRKATAAWVAYRVAQGGLEGTGLVAWTTTPWTLSGSRALAFGPDVAYALYRAERQTDGDGAADAGLRREPRRLVLAQSRAAAFEAATGLTLVFERDVPVSDLEGLRVHHPFAALEDADGAWSAPLPCLPGSHVTDASGSGLVHTAPGHGAEDFALGRAHGLDLSPVLTSDGRLLPDMPLMGGSCVVTPDGRDGPANGQALDLLSEAGALLGVDRLTHSYPHSWRSKAPVVFRATPQWFAGMDVPLKNTDDRLGFTLRERATRALDEVHFHPARARHRLEAMLRDRPDWVLSRQRLWGVPLPLFTRKDLPASHPDFLLRDPEVDARVLAAFETEGADAWFADGAKERFLGADHDPELFDQCMDVLDVWFDSGSTHSWAMQGAEVSDLCAEGTDQHRGWFQAALLHSCATRGRAPYRAVMTHGFTLDAKGRKMSKSLGNVTTPAKLVETVGADVLRLQVALGDHTGDTRLSEAALSGAREMYRRMRNTLRFCLGVLGDASPTPEADAEAMPMLDQWLLDRAADTDAAVRQAYADLDPASAMQAAHAFLNHDLSQVWASARKDVLYCDEADSPRRRAALHALSVCLSSALSWLAPVLVFVTEDAWRRRTGDVGVHGTRFTDLSAYRRPDAQDWMAGLLPLRDRGLAALEEARVSGRVTKPGLARVTLAAPGVSADMLADLALLLSAADVVAGHEDRADLSALHECPRCRMASGDVAPDAGGLCPRCDRAVAGAASGYDLPESR